MKSIWEKIKLAFNRKHVGDILTPIQTIEPIKKVRVRKKKESTDASK
jgi:hypothetical protein